VLWLRAAVASHVGRLDDARAAIAEADSLGVSDNLHGLRRRALLGFVALCEGAYGEALAALEPLPDALETLGIREPGIVLYQGDLIEALTRAGRAADAQARIDALEPLARRLDRPRALVWVHRGRGVLAAQEGDFARAERELELALAQSRRRPLAFEEARTLLALGAVLRRARRRAAARATLDAARSAFAALGSDLWCLKAEEELARIGGRARRTPGMTSTEERVAELAAQGLTNREIAARLFVSRYTVNGHTRAIYGKLGVRRRSDAVAAAVRAGLLETGSGND
jgi:ATP/maltotriose-dependent transcriptional regulator MalT